MFSSVSSDARKRAPEIDVRLIRLGPRCHPARPKSVSFFVRRSSTWFLTVSTCAPEPRVKQLLAPLVMAAGLQPGVERQHANSEVITQALGSATGPSSQNARIRSAWRRQERVSACTESGTSGSPDQYHCLAPSTAHVTIASCSPSPPTGSALSVWNPRGGRSWPPAVPRLPEGEKGKVSNANRPPRSVVGLGDVRDVVGGDEQSCAWPGTSCCLWQMYRALISRHR